MRAGSQVFCTKHVRRARMTPPAALPWPREADSEMARPRPKHPAGVAVLAWICSSRALPPPGEADAHVRRLVAQAHAQAQDQVARELGVQPQFRQHLRLELAVRVDALDERD